ncbi:hypothetical protein EON63_05590 [archaeon]|nr:MAG: hypothetical protein EON63_05590 [archaeon]
MHAMESLIHLLSGIQNTNVGVEGRQNGFLYQSHFCEENIYCLVRDLLSHHHELSVWGIELFPIFISSQSKATPIWHQKAGNPVCWDYHVILYVTETNMRGQGVILDFDTTQPFCTPVLEYIMKSFRPDMGIKPEYQQ